MRHHLRLKLYIVNLDVAQADASFDFKVLGSFAGRHADKLNVCQKSIDAVVDIP